jgi:hypothetical protein
VRNDRATQATLSLAPPDDNGEWGIVVTLQDGIGIPAPAEVWETEDGSLGTIKCPSY